MGSADDKESFASLFESTEGAKRKRAQVRRGDRLDVKVVAISQTAVFVDLGGKEEGYFERVDLLDSRGNLTVEVGTSIGAVVAETDGERIRLSPVFVRNKTDSVIGDGPEAVALPGKTGPLLVEGSIVTGVVTGVERYGVFVQIDGTRGRNGRGLVPTAETGAPRGADLRKLFPDGAPCSAKILAIQEDGKIRLSIKAARDDEERRDFEEYARAEREGGAAEPTDAAPPGAASHKPIPPPKRGAPAPRNLGTLGDLLSRTAKKK